jgi:inner membrane protein
VPSPIGHVLAGAAVVYAGDAIDRRRSPISLVATCALLGAVADLDLLLPRYHRSFTHSLTAVAFIFIVAAAVTGEVTHLRAPRYGGQARGLAARFGGPGGGQARWRVPLICACAYATHLLLDWLGSDTLPPYGLQLFWPFSNRFFVSGLNLFAETERRHLFSGPTLVQNLWAAAQEVAILAPITGALWLVRVKALARLPAEVPRGDHAPQ